MSWRCLPGGSSSKEPACQCRRHKSRGFDPWVGKIPWRRGWQTTPVLLPGESQGERSLVGYSPWSHKNQTWLKWLSMHAHASESVHLCFSLVWRFLANISSNVISSTFCQGLQQPHPDPSYFILQSLSSSFTSSTPVLLSIPFWIVFSGYFPND